MTETRQFEICIAQMVVPMPCFFPSVSSVKTNLMPVDYVELLDASSYPLFLISAYDIANSIPEHRKRMDSALKRSKANHKAILMDSGNYESFWKGDPTWVADRFHGIAQTSEYHLCFCYDNQKPPVTAEAIANDVVASVLRDQDHALGTVAPIVHGKTELLPAATQRVAEQLCPILLAVPERALGEGIVARTRSVRIIRKALNELGFYCPLHLLGTGNPLSIIAYAMAGADCFDGLEWCQTVIDHDTGELFHFQHWDLFRNQTEWGANSTLPYIQSVLMHNLEFYGQFMRNLHDALECNTAEDFLKRHVPESQAKSLLDAIEGGI